MYKETFTVNQLLLACEKISRVSPLNFIGRALDLYAKGPGFKPQQRQLPSLMLKALCNIFITNFHPI